MTLATFTASPIDLDMAAEILREAIIANPTATHVEVPTDELRAVCDALEAHQAGEWRHRWTP